MVKSMNKILIIEDNPVNMDIFEEILEDDFELKKAFNGQDALDIIESYMPDLVLLDVMMPNMDGPTTLQKLREQESTKSKITAFVYARIHEIESDHPIGEQADSYNH